MAPPAAAADSAPVENDPSARSAGDLPAGVATGRGAGSGKVLSNGVAAPAQPSGPDALAYLRHGDPGRALVPAGVNDPACRVTADRPSAVIVVHGTGGSVYTDYSALATALVDDGWCVFGADLGLADDPADGFGHQPLEESLRELDRLINAATTTSGADTVSLVGYSQGAVLARMWVNTIDRGATTDTVVLLASPTRGATLWGLAGLLPLAKAIEHVYPPLRGKLVNPALVELVPGSPLLARVNSPGETVPGPAYVTIQSRYDEYIPDQATQPVHGPKTRSLVITDLCPRETIGHIDMTYSPTVIDATRYLLRNWSMGGLRGQIRCVDRFPGTAAAHSAIVVNLLKLRYGRFIPTPVIYATVI
ncbi:esterase/lipase family protein [Corynebacterium mendelii]|uniref:Alpha/beta hydrolase n=1 Tax=Corynebacterium mendelii TaxID=2765362 RepID=A0A939DZL6_9CORY|nr:alpha/beta hydrolase [Corynebacterium mendelii]MBN9643143.1 alpha/beta hydrolase [Corynebacterium mendelii]